MPLHNRRRTEDRNKDRSQKASGQFRKRLKRRKSSTRCGSIQWLYVTLALIVLRVTFHYVLEDTSYDWVSQRCFLSWTSLPARLACMEAWYHREANRNMGLLWTSDLLPGLTKAQVSQVQATMEATQQAIAQKVTPTAQHVHYTLTASLTNTNVQDLALCSIESMVNMCATANKHCVVHLWVVDRAAIDILQDNHTDFFIQFMNMMQWAPHCIHVIDNPLESDVPLSTFLPHANNPDCPPPPPPRSSRHADTVHRMRTWLATKEARTQQLAEHASDAWRLVALLSYGGLYLDLDVVPLSPLLLHLPYNSLPVQHRVGAYRINGGVLRLGDGEENEDVGGKVSTHLLRHAATPTESSFLDALAEDHLYWAPQLASLPTNQQTFGFLGPAALTRVYCQLTSANNITILPHTNVEPPLDTSLCESTTSLAAHFSTQRKYSFPSNVWRYPCLTQKFATDACPATMNRLMGP